MSQLSKMQSSDLIGGEVAPEFESVREAFERHCGDLGKGGGGFAAFIDDQKVVDLYAGEARPGVPWGPETLGVLFSTTKALSTICTQILADCGQLDIDQPVATYWPAFAKHGKETVSVRHILSHTSGILELPGYADLLTWDGAGFDQYEEISHRLENARLCWPPGTRHGYQAATFGWLVARLVQLITGRSLGAFFAESVAKPLGLELRIGTPERHHSRIPNFSNTSSVRPNDPERARIWDIWHDPNTLSGKAFLAKKDGNAFDHMPRLMNNPRILAAEIGASNATGAAHDLAQFFAVLACGGELGGVRLLSRERVFEWAREQTRGIDAVSLMPWRWALGYHLQSDALTASGHRSGPFGPNLNGAFGHVGFGGQVGGADPQRRVAMAFLRNELTDNFRLPSVLVQSLYERL